MGNTTQKGDSGEIRYQRLVEEAPGVMMVLGPDFMVRYARRAVGRILGIDPRRVAGNPFSAYLHPEDEAWARDLCVASGCGARRSSREIRVRHADGSWCWFEAVAADLLDDPGVRGVAIYLHDVTGGRKLRDQLAHCAFHDPLTGLPNRALFEDRLKQAFARAERRRGPVTVLFVDLDDFKAVNDGFGHEMGDKLLAAVGQRLEETLRPGDTVARLGGDEFAVLIEASGEALAATRTTERLARALRQPIVVGGRTMFVTSSVGGAEDAPHVALTIQKLQLLGIKLVADDFGRGSCPLSYLGRFRVDLLKIGRSFVGRLGRGEEDVAKLVRAMIGFARAMGIPAVASGVETAEQADILHKNGCEQAQGFYFFEPVPADAVTRILDSDRGVGQMPLHDRVAVVKGAH